MPNAKRRWLENNHSRNPYCHWCGVPTILPIRGVSQGLSSNTATKDHLVMKKLRRKGVKEDSKAVLACFKCNNERSVQQTGLARRVNTQLRDKLKEIIAAPYDCSSIQG